MSDKPDFADLQRMLDGEESLSEDDRELLGSMLAEMRRVSGSTAGATALAPEELARRRGNLREAWVKAFEACRKVEIAEGDLLVTGADLAETMRDATMTLLRSAHEIRRSFDEGTFTGTWEQREELMEKLTGMEDDRASMLERLTAEDIRQLKAEGALYDL